MVNDTCSLTTKRKSRMVFFTCMKDTILASLWFSRSTSESLEVPERSCLAPFFFLTSTSGYAKTSLHSNAPGYDPQASGTGYDPQASGMSEACVGMLARGCRSLLHQAGALDVLWALAIILFNELRCTTKRQIGRWHRISASVGAAKRLQ